MPSSSPAARIGPISEGIWQSRFQAECFLPLIAPTDPRRTSPDVPSAAHRVVGSKTQPSRRTPGSVIFPSHSARWRRRIDLLARYKEIGPTLR